MKYADSKNSTQSFWIIRAGVGGEAHNEFIDNSIIALADPGLGNLKNLDAKREAYLHAYTDAHPSQKRSSVAGTAGKFYRFVHEVQIGDRVLYPAVTEKRIYVGEIVGGYVYLQQSKPFCHRRTVKWLGTVNRDELSEQARREMGAARTFFKLQRTQQEVARIIVAKSLSPLSDKHRQFETAVPLTSQHRKARP